MDLSDERGNRSEMEEWLARKKPGVYTVARFKCPFHEDNDPSGSIYRGKANEWRFKCFGPCGIDEDVLGVESLVTGESSKEILSRMRREKMPNEKPAQPLTAFVECPPNVYASVEDAERGYLGRNAGRWEYSTASGEVEFYIYRINTATGKQFYPLRKQADGTWIDRKDKDAPHMPVYNRAGINGKATVVFAEGEKSADLFNALGIPATTTPGGAKATVNGVFDWSPLAGKNVYMWPDNDKTGFEHAGRVVKSLEGVGCSVRMVDIAKNGMNDEGDDIEEFLSRITGDDVARRQAVIAALQRTVASGIEAEMISIVEREERGECLPIMWPWQMFNQHFQYSTPGTVSMLIAPPSSSKSFGVIEAATFWCEMDIPFALYELENRCSMHSFRALAQKTKQPGLTRPEWRAANSEETRDYISQHSALLKKLNKQMYGRGENTPTKDSLIEWMKARAAEKPRIIVIDPITARKSGRDQWLDDEDFVDGLKSVVDLCPDVNITLVTHPRKGATEPHLDNIAGGASFGRLLEKAVWIQAVYPHVKSMCKNSMVTMEREHNRIFHALKLRDMAGTGMRIAMNFSPVDLCFHEFGIIVAKDAAKRGEITPFEQRAIAYSQQRVNEPAKPVEQNYDEDDDLFL